MNSVTKIIRHEYLKILKGRSFQITTILVMVLLLGGSIILNITNNTENDSTNSITAVGYVDTSGCFSQDLLLEKISFTKYPNDKAALAAMVQGDIYNFLVFGPDYLVDGFVLNVSTNNTMTNDYFLESLRRFIVINLMGQEIAPEVVDRLLNPYVISSILVDENGNPVEDTYKGGVAILLPYLFTLFMIICIFSTSGFLMQGLSEEKENRIMEVLLSSVSTKELLIGKIIGLGAIGLTQICIWVATAAVAIAIVGDGMSSELFNGLSIAPDFAIVALLIFVLGYLLFAGLMGAFSVIGASARDSQQYAMFFTLPAVVPIFFMVSILNHPQGLVSHILTFFPLTAPSTIIMRYSIGELPLWELITAVIVLLGAIALTAWFANKVFKTFLLMYGKTPKISEILKILKQS